MKRMNVMVDEEVLMAAMLEMGEFKASAAINKALAEITKVLRVRKGIRAIGGSGAWEGDLAQMRATRFPAPLDVPSEKKIAAKTVGVSRSKKAKQAKRGSRGHQSVGAADRVRNAIARFTLLQAVNLSG